jgi:hypothetical protein
MNNELGRLFTLSNIGVINSKLKTIRQPELYEMHEVLAVGH